ncbi:hypothetical protein I3I95_03360 [bacterium]|nr:hypothetical protein [bacterium]
MTRDASGALEDRSPTTRGKTAADGCRTSRVATADEAAAERRAREIVDEAARRAKEPVHAFDPLIDRVRAVIPADARVTMAPPPDELPFAFGPHAGRGVILRSGCAVELGGELEGSCALTMSTSDETLVRDGCVTIVGPDPCAMPKGSVSPFAQIIIAAGQGLACEEHQAIEDCQGVTDWIQGYMVRALPGMVWARVGTERYDGGLTLAQLGRALIELVKSSDAHVRAAEVMLVTSSKKDVEGIAALRDEWQGISHRLRHDTWMGKGLDIDCPSGGHCGSCGDKDVCDQVRRIQHLRRAVQTTQEEMG